MRHADHREDAVSRAPWAKIVLADVGPILNDEHTMSNPSRAFDS